MPVCAAFLHQVGAWRQNFPDHRLADRIDHTARRGNAKQSCLNSDLRQRNPEDLAAPCGKTLRLGVHFRFECVLLDELPAGFHHVAHELREHLVRGIGVFDAHLKKCAHVRVEGGFPELLRVHLA